MLLNAFFCRSVWIISSLSRRMFQNYIRQNKIVCQIVILNGYSLCLESGIVIRHEIL